MKCDKVFIFDIGYMSSKPTEVRFQTDDFEITWI